QSYPRRLGMLGGVGDGFLGDPIEAGGETRRQRVSAARQLELESRRPVAAYVPAGDQPLEARGEAELVDVGRAQADQRAPQRLHHVSGGPRDALAVWQQRRAFVAGGLAGGRGDGADRGEALAEFVMKLAGEKLPLLVL